MKSISSVILKDFISGSAIITFGFPPYAFNFASASPKVLETLKKYFLSIVRHFLQIIFQVTREKALELFEMLLQNYFAFELFVTGFYKPIQTNKFIC